jgi:hypothetical protein
VQRAIGGARRSLDRSGQRFVAIREEGAAGFDAEEVTP